MSSPRRDFLKNLVALGALPGLFARPETLASLLDPQAAKQARHRADEASQDLAGIRITRYPPLCCCHGFGNSATTSLPMMQHTSCLPNNWALRSLHATVAWLPLRATSQESS